jgi:hypothetical protein
MHSSGPRLRLSAFLLPLAVLACDGDDVSGPTGSLEVTSLTSGVELDPNGYVVMLDGRGVGTIGANGSTLIPDVAAGEHQVDLSGVADNCQVEGERPRSITVTESEGVSVAFSIACGDALPPGDGELEVTVQTGGSSVDQDGYGVALYHVTGPAIPINGTVTIGNLPAGDQAVGLVGVAPNCAVVGEHPVRLTLKSAVPASVVFTVVCHTPLPAPWPILGNGPHDLTHVSGTSSNNVFTIGHGQAPCATCEPALSILRYDGDVLTTQRSDFGRALDIWAASSGAAFALVDDASPSPFLRYNGASWFSVPAGEVQPGSGGGGFFGLWGSSATDAYAVGDSVDAGSVAHPSAARWNGSEWLAVDLPSVPGLSLADVWGSSDVDVYAVGAIAVPDDSTDRGVVLHFDGDTWSLVHDEPHLAFVRVGGSGPSDVWVTGHALMPTGAALAEQPGHGAIRRFDGTGWATVQSPTSAPIGAVSAVSSSQVYVIADGGQGESVWRYDGTSWVELRLRAGNLFDIWGSSGGEVFAVGANGVVLRGP